MSIESWKKKYYPVEAREVAYTDPLARIEHSIEKWRGLTPSVLDKHGIAVTSLGDLRDGESTFCIDSRSCALCLAHATSCENCEITIATGELCAGPDSPFSAWMKKHDPKPMLAALRQTLKFYRDGANA